MKMKKNYLMMAMAAAMLASCAQTGVIEDVDFEETPKAIGFNTFADKQVRATENSDENYGWDMEDHHATYTVYGFKTVKSNNSDVFPGLEVNSATGVYSPKKYWDKAASSYGFFAHAGDATFVKEVNGTASNMADDYFTIASYTVPATNLNETAYGTVVESFKSEFPGKDLMIAAACDHTAIGTDVTLNFIHILSRLNVMVKTDMTTDADNYIEIAVVEVHNLAAKGEFKENVSITPPATLAGGTNERWTLVDPTTETVDNKYNSAGEKLSATAANHYVIQALVMPQVAEYQEIDLDGTDAETSAKPYIKITYSVTTSGVEQPSCTYYYNLADAFGNADLAFNEGWQNNLTITIAPQSINFVGNVAKWDDGADKGLTVN